MPRYRKNSISSSALSLPPALLTLAQVIGEAVGQGVAHALASRGIGTGNASTAASERGRGRPKGLTSGSAALERRCTVLGCGREPRSKGLCSAHYQAERRRLLAANKQP
jgi:hypothetical protein